MHRAPIILPSIGPPLSATRKSSQPGIRRQMTALRFGLPPPPPASPTIKPTISRCNTFQKNLPLMQLRGPRRDSSPSLLLKHVESIVTIRVYSNWGHPELLACSEIQFFDAHKERQLIQSSTISPDGHDDKLPFLYNRDFFPTKLESVWSTSWPRDPKTQFELNFHIDSKNPVCSITMWPFSSLPNANMREIEVFIDGYSAYKGEINNTFGDTIFLTKENRMSFVTQTQMNTKNKLADENGLLPITKIGTITISVLSVYLDSNIFGLNQIMCFDYQGHIIDMNRSSTIRLVGMEDPANRWLLTRQLEENEEPFTAIRKPDCQFQITFPIPIPIAAICLINYDFKHEGMKGVKDLAIRVNGFLMWTGRISPKVEDKSDGQRIVYFAASDGYKGLISSTVNEWVKQHVTQTRPQADFQ